MSYQIKRSDDLAKKIRQFYALEKNSSLSKARRFKYSAYRWALMLYSEAIKDDVKVRAESLSFLMIFSLLPLIAGIFFIFTVFAQFGMVQEALQGALERMLSTIPSDNRQVIEEYVLQFKDMYLSSISGQSGQLGIFALAILAWVGLQTFNNIDRTINFIWSSDQQRPFIEKIRNFIVVSVGAPLVIVASLSIPLILKKLPYTRELFESLPFLFGLLNLTISIAIIVGTFTVLYRYVPVRKVPWKSAVAGAIFAATFLQIANGIMHLYFKIGTNSAYGKAAVVPLIGFWIYLVWIIVIVGAELSYLVQNEKYLVRSFTLPPTFFEGECLLAILCLLQRNFEDGKGPSTWSDFFQHTHLGGQPLKRIIDFLQDNRIMVPCASYQSKFETEYTLGRDMRDEGLRPLLEAYIVRDRPQTDEVVVSRRFTESLGAWLDFFGEMKVQDLLARKKRSSGD